MTVITRFAPSPTGFLHIGSARTALFNWLFAKHHGGKFLLRIEDTDRARSTQPAIEAILDGMEWLGLHHDGEVIYQFARAARHAEVAKQLVDKGQAYYCYCTTEELAAMREEATKEGKGFRYDGRWRDKPASEAPEGINPVIRLKAPLTGETVIDDLVQGRVVVGNEHLDDMILLRSDGTPTYMLAVVVDDHDMAVTHVIRGDDHLTNASRQKLIYEAMGWETPKFAHIPLIHGADGAKLSKRHGALGVEAYRDMGFLPEAIRNYLLRLGWAHGDDEIIDTAQAIQWFDVDGLGKSPSRFDMVKLTNVNGHYMREAENERLVTLITPLIEERLKAPVSQVAEICLAKGMNGLKQRAKNLLELTDNALFYARSVPLPFTDKAQQILDKGGKELAGEIAALLDTTPSWEEAALEEVIKTYAVEKGMKLGDLAQVVRVALTGSTISPSIFEVLAVLGKEESLRRLR